MVIVRNLKPATLAALVLEATLDQNAAQAQSRSKPTASATFPAKPSKSSRQA